MERITSSHNPLVQHMRKLQTSRAYRESCGEFVADGWKLLEEALKWYPEVTAVLTSEPERCPALPSSARLVEVPASLMQSVSSMRTPQGVLFSLRLPQEGALRVQPGMLLLDRIQDPGNLGTILRTADAFDLPVLLTNGCADPFSEKTVRASMGAVFRRPPQSAPMEDVLRACHAAGIPIAATALSGTYQSACIAAADYEDIYVVDSRSAAIGSGILAELALEWAADGMAAAELAGLLTKKRDDICLLGLLDTLEYLRRGGRISRTAALAGGLLGIKPVVTLENGAVTMIGKARGSKQGNNLLVQKVRESGGIDFSLPILLGYTGLSDALLQKYVADSAALWRDHCGSLEQTLLCSVIGTHTGPGVVAVAFFKNGV